jgi:hypothetical protein
MIAGDAAFVTVALVMAVISGLQLLIPSSFASISAVPAGSTSGLTGE